MFIVFKMDWSLFAHLISLAYLSPYVYVFLLSVLLQWSLKLVWADEEILVDPDKVEGDVAV